MGVFNALERAAICGDASLAELAISKGANVQKCNGTPLHLAAEYDQPDVIRVLVKNGAQINTTDIYLDTPLLVAACSQSAQAVKVLLELGADMTITDVGGSPLHTSQPPTGTLTP